MAVVVEDTLIQRLVKEEKQEMPILVVEEVVEEVVSQEDVAVQEVHG